MGLDLENTAVLCEYFKKKDRSCSQPLTCVVMPDAYFPDLSEIGICFNLEVIQAVPLESSFTLKVT